MPRLQDETVARSSDNFRLPVLFISLVPRLRRAFPMIGRARGVSECVRTAQGPKMLSGGKGIKEYLRMRKGVMSQLLLQCRPRANDREQKKLRQLWEVFPVCMPRWG